MFIKPNLHPAHLLSKALIALIAIHPAFAALQAKSSPPQLITTSTIREETRYVVRCLERIHYLSQPIDELDANVFIENFISDLDTHRLFFNQSEIENFKLRFKDNISDFLYQGNIYPAFVIFEAYRDNGAERIDWILRILEGDFDFTTDETYAPDRLKSPWPATDEESDVLWRKRIKYELLNELMSQAATNDLSNDADAIEDDTDHLETAIKDPEQFAPLLAEAKESVRKRYERMKKTLLNIESTEVEELFLTCLTQMYDPHSNFLSADSLDEFAIAMRNSLVGIGAILSDDEGYCTIRELLPGGPAERSNLLKPNDKIVGVAQEGEKEFTDVIGLKLSKIVKIIRGKKGSVVRLLIRPIDGDPGERRIVELVRDEIKLTANLAQAKVFEIDKEDETLLLGVIDLPAFYGSSGDQSSTTKDVEELLNKLKAMKVQGIVLDLRRNGGGLLSEAIDLTGLFIPVGPVVQVRDTVGQIKEYLDQDPKVVWDGPLIVLVSRYSASASEIAAGALENHNRAIIVGDEDTHGKGTVQAVFEMNNGGFLSALKPRRGAAKVTIQKYYLPDGSSTQIEGVNSDIVLPSINKYLPIGESDLPNALEWDTVKPLEWNYGYDFKINGASINDDLIAYLSERSSERRSNLEEFQYLRDQIDWFRPRQEQKEISLNIYKRLDIRNDDERFRETMEKRLEVLKEHNFPSSKILLNVTEAQNAEHDRIVAEQANKDSESISQDADNSGETSDKEPAFDIHLRESLRILADWVNFKPAETASVAVHQNSDSGSMLKETLTLDEDS